MRQATPKQQKILKEGLEYQYITIREYKSALNDSKLAYELIGEIFRQHNKREKERQIAVLKMLNGCFNQLPFDEFPNGIYCSDDM